MIRVIMVKDNSSNSNSSSSSNSKAVWDSNSNNSNNSNNNKEGVTRSNCKANCKSSCKRVVSICTVTSNRRERSLLLLISQLKQFKALPKQRHR